MVIDFDIMQQCRTTGPRRCCRCRCRQDFVRLITTTEHSIPLSPSSIAPRTRHGHLHHLAHALTHNRLVSSRRPSPCSSGIWQSPSSPFPFRSQCQYRPPHPFPFQYVLLSHQTFSPSILCV